MYFAKDGRDTIRDCRMNAADATGFEHTGGPEGTAPFSLTRKSGRSARFLLAFVVLLDVVLGAGAIHHVVRSEFDADEVEHTHVIWSMNQGIMPYRDLHQVHAPLLWIVCAPIVRWMPSDVETIVVLRALCLAAFAGAAWWACWCFERSSGE